MESFYYLLHCAWTQIQNRYKYIYYMLALAKNTKDLHAICLTLMMDGNIKGVLFVTAHIGNTHEVYRMCLCLP